MKTLLAAFLITFSFLFASCEDEKKEESGAEEFGITPKQQVISQGQPRIQQTSHTSDDPEIIDIKSEPAADEFLKLKAAGTKDLRPHAPASYSMPPLIANFDPRTFTPSGNYIPGAGVIDRDIFSGQISVPSFGRMKEHAACEFPFAAPGNVMQTIVIDGDLSDWDRANVIGVDRSGDVENSAIDLTELYFTKDATYLYIGAKTHGAWSLLNDSSERLILGFREIILPVDSSTHPGLGASRSLEIWGSQFWENDGGYAQVVQGNGAGEVDYVVATSGSSMEFKIKLTEITGLMNGNPWQLDTYSANSSAVIDSIGIHKVGYVDDYACMVSMPDSTGSYDSHKMFVFRRTESSIDVGTAENMYRAMVAGAQAVEYVTKDHLDLWDTISVSSLVDMSAAGVYSPSFGIYMAGNTSSALGEINSPYETFHIAAHEYLHGFNASDYGLSETWTIEGHSQWMSYKAIESYYGSAAYQWETSYAARKFLSEEKNVPSAVTSIETSKWGDAPNSGLYYYRKAHTLYELIGPRIDYDDMLANVLRLGPATNSSFMTQIKNQPSYIGLSADDMTSGWFGGNYSDSIFPSNILEDDDSDGLLNHLEVKAGTSSTTSDTDEDHVSDMFEKSNNLNPTLKDRHEFLAADNNLSDWDALVPHVFNSKTIYSDLASPCGPHAQLKRYGAVYSEGWILISLELENLPTAAEAEGLLAVVFVKEPARDVQFQVHWGEAFVRGFVVPTRNTPSLTPFKGKALEIAYNAEWLGWNNGEFLDGTTFTVALFEGTTECFEGEPIIPAQNL